MSATTILAIAIPVLVVLAAVAFFAAGRRRDARGAVGTLSRETRSRDRGQNPALLPDEQVEEAIHGRSYEKAMLASSGAVVVAPKAPAPTAWKPPDPDAVGVSRRQFFNRSIIALMVLGLSGFGAAVLAFLWPSLKGGFGSKISLGNLDDLLTNIRSGNGFFYVPEGRAWITEYPKESLAKAQAVYPPNVLAGMEAGIVALYQKCPHLGCRVPDCQSSQWFECPCHGSKYNQVGEHKAGPAPRGMDHFAVSLAGSSVTIDTGVIIGGAPVGTNTTGQEAEGPHCVGAGGSH